MAAFDLVIRGGTLVDGTGVPKRRADIAMKDGRVAEIGSRISAGAAREIDAGGCIVAPGAIDLHTHYDAQLNWDPYATLSGWHGVTSLTIGECGFGFAPTRPEDRDLNMRMMDRIEAIPLESMRQGMRWDWETFPEFLDSLEGHGLGVNVGALVPFSPIRGYVLGMLPARERTSVTNAELNQMKQLFYDGMKAGGFGFSLDKNMEDHAEDGGFLPSHVASDDEFHAFAKVLAEFNVGHVGLTLGPGLTETERQGVRALTADIMRLSGRPAHLLDVHRGDADAQAWIADCLAEGLPLYIQSSCVGATQRFTLAEYNMYDYMPSWIQPLVGTPEERLAKLRDPAVRPAMKRDVEAWPNLRTDWDKVMVREVVHQRNHDHEGRTINQLAAAVGKEPLDAFLDLAIDEGLATEFELPSTRTEEQARVQRETLRSPNVHISMSDGGAHTRFLTLSTWPIVWLSYWVRDMEFFTLEEAHFKMSALPAWLVGLTHRGTLKEGNWADIIVYNQAELGFVYDKPTFANDFPGGERRIVQKPTGLRYTIVNGTVTFEGNDCSGALPGKLLRSYDLGG
ncbi:MAG: amidohydrolase family protein [Chloroflexi bacterium]|nr:amidohydrolase family protein [Chloroflexota bacterium]